MGNVAPHLGRLVGWAGPGLSGDGPPSERVADAGIDALHAADSAPVGCTACLDCVGSLHGCVATFAILGSWGLDRRSRRDRRFELNAAACGGGAAAPASDPSAPSASTPAEGATPAEPSDPAALRRVRGSERRAERSCRAVRDPTPLEVCGQMCDKHGAALLRKRGEELSASTARSSTSSRRRAATTTRARRSNARATPRTFSARRSRR